MVILNVRGLKNLAFDFIKASIAVLRVDLVFSSAAQYRRTI
jgi:hypothetical protein